MIDFLHEISHQWTLFLDRDGVINKRPPGDYIKRWEDFGFLPGVLDALKIMAGKFSRVIVITNQQGIGKGIMTGRDVENIHLKMQQVVSEHGGRIFAVYYCPDLATKADNCRKPNGDMATQAKQDFPEIDFSKCIMAGDMVSDMEFGKKLGMKTIYIDSNKSPADPALYDTVFPDLLSFARFMNPVSGIPPEVVIH